MKRRTKILITLAVASVGAFCLGACSDGSPYSRLEKEGHGNVKVHFNVSGGRFAGQEQIEVVDLFTYESVERGLQILAPDDPKRGAMNVTSASRSGYFLAGWYAKREPRVNAAGEPLDDDGNVCKETPVLDEEGNEVYDDGKLVTEYLSESGKGQAYTYSEPWTFGDRLTADRLEKDGAFYEFTLYAAWVPDFSYRIFAEVDGQWQVVATTAYSPVTGESLQEVDVPVWNEETGAMDYDKFPRASYTKVENGETRRINLTFLELFEDQAKTKHADKLVHKGTWDPATGVSTGGIQDYYATYMEGDWYRIKTAAQFAANMNAEGCYEILDDLTFDETTPWPSNISTGDFNGIINGNDHKIVGATATCTGNSTTYAGLFGRLGAYAEIKNVTFEDATFYLAQGASRNSEASFGLFAGYVSSTTKLENIKISGKFVIGLDSTLAIDEFFTNVTSSGDMSYRIGKVSGSYDLASVKGIDASNIEVVEQQNVQVEVGSDNSIKVRKRTEA